MYKCCLLSSDEVMSHSIPLILTGFYSTQGPSHLFLPRLQLSCKFMGGKKIKLHYSRWSLICTTLIIVNLKCAGVFWSFFCPVYVLLCQHEPSMFSSTYVNILLMGSYTYRVTQKDGNFWKTQQKLKKSKKKNLLTEIETLQLAF